MTEHAANPRASHDFEIKETIEAGIVLKGYEVKSIKTGKASLRGSYVKIINGAPMLVGATIAPYQEANTPQGYDPQSSRSLLLSRKEIDRLIGLSKTQGMTLVPLKLYSKGRRIKILIGIARGKKKYDKRETIKKKEFERREKRMVS